MSARLGWSLAGVVLSAVVVYVGVTVSWTAVGVFALIWAGVLTIAWNLRTRP